MRSSRQTAGRPRRLAPRLEALEDRATPATITVTTVADDLRPGDGRVSLREAITAINAGNDLGDADILAQSPGTFGSGDTINFDLPGDGVRGINVGTDPSASGIPLPTIIKTVTIDGYSQPGASANTLANGGDARVLIEIDGDGAGPNASGLVLGPGSGGSTIKGLAINRFSGNGIEVRSDGNVIAGNFIGTAARPNQLGIRIVSASNNTVGGLTPAARNVVSGNQHAGIHVVGTTASPAAGNLIQGNFVGVNAAGTGPAGNLGSGIEISGGNGNSVARNVVGFNADGIEVNDGGRDNVIQGNFVGVAADGVTQVGNARHGIVLRSSGQLPAPDGPGQANEPAVSGNVIGLDPRNDFTGQGNVVAFNGAGGVVVFGNPPQNNATQAQNSGNSILGNSIYLNGRGGTATSSLGIDLSNQSAFPAADGVTANDQGKDLAGMPAPHGDASNPNNFQNHPVLSEVTRVNGGTRITGSLAQSVSPGTTYRIEFFANGANPLGRPAEGRAFLGAVTVTSDAAGTASFSASFDVNLAPGQTVTATATNLTADPSSPAGSADLFNTSEFSAGVTFVGAPANPNGPPPDQGVNRALVRGLYRAILNREADPSGLTYWAGRLDARLSVSQVAQTFYASAERCGLEVDGLYRTYLNRNADPAGRAFWVGRLQSGVTGEQVAIAFVSSAEYSQLHQTNEAFVSALSHDVLGGPIDPTRHANRISRLAGGTSRAVLARETVTSDEARLRVVDDLFSRFLRRAGDPGGRQGHLQRLRDGATEAMVAAIFAASPEFRENASRAAP